MLDGRIFSRINHRPTMMHVPDKHIERMRTHHFRGWTNALAGNLCRPAWDEPCDVLMAFKDELEAEIERAILANDFETRSIQLEAKTYVGWTSAVRYEKGLEGDLELFCPNKRSTAMRIRRNTTWLAPLTNMITFVYKVYLNERGYNVPFFTMYPGFDVGELCDDITARERVVFFDWDHPGQPLGS